MSYNRAAGVTGVAIASSTAMAVLIAILASSFLRVGLAPPSLAYQVDALDTLVTTGARLGAFALAVAALSLALHALSRVLARWRELAIRCALGATFRHLLRLVGTDLLRLQLAGAAAGGAAGGALLALLRSTWPALFTRPPLLLPAIAAGAGAAALAAALGLGIAATLLLLLQRGGVRSVGELQGSAVTSGPGLMLLQSAFAVLQVAGLVVVAYGCAVLLRDARSAVRITALDIPPDRLVAPVSWPAAASDSERPSERLRALPSSGDVRAAFTSADAWLGMQPERFLVATCGDCFVGTTLRPINGGRVRVMAALPGALAVAGQRVSGREISAGDTIGAPAVAVLNAAAARLLFPNANPVGRTVRGGRSLERSWRVVGLTPFTPPPVFANTPQVPVLFLSALQDPPERLEATARAGVWDSLRAAIADARSDAPRLGRPATLASRAELFTQPLAWFGVVFTGLAGSATGIAAWSLVAVMTQAVALREREIGIRMAVGATRGQVAAWVARRTAWTTVTGLALGFSAARGIGVLLHGQLSAEGDVGLLLAATLLILGLGLLASIRPALLATRVEPAVIWAGTQRRRR